MRGAPVGLQDSFGLRLSDLRQSNELVHGHPKLFQELLANHKNSSSFIRSKKAQRFVCSLPLSRKRTKRCTRSSLVVNSKELSVIKRHSIFKFTVSQLYGFDGTFVQRAVKRSQWWNLLSSDKLICS